MSNYISLFYNTPLGRRFDEGSLPIIAGYCTVPDRERTLEMARQLSKLPYVVGMRGGAYKPRTDPDSFQGHGREGLVWLKEAYDKTGLPIVTEIMDSKDLEVFEDVFGSEMNRYVGLQIGSRTMQAYGLLKNVAEKRKEYPGLTVLLKRGMCSTSEEVLGAVRHLGDDSVLLCLRGLQKIDYGSPEIEKMRDERKYQNSDFRYYSDVEEIPFFREFLRDRENVIVGFDPSHVSGQVRYVPGVSIDAAENEADFLLIETMLDSDKRDELLCDGQQALTISQLKKLYPRLQRIYSDKRGRLG